VAYCGQSTETYIERQKRFIIPLSACFSGPSRKGLASGMAGDTSSVRLSPTSSTVSPRCPYRGPPAPAFRTSPGIGYRLPLCLPWFWKSGDDANPFRLGNPHHRRKLARLKANATPWGKEARVVYSRDCAPRRSKGGKLARSAPKSRGRQISRVARFEQGAYVRDTFNRLSGKVSVEWGGTLCPGCRPFSFTWELSR
jgi:hypothetical protein